ncbi:hypothetical protein [Roseateles sp.]|jgi:hypothetical protein|uniref:hypothetical protein n=1 Tax=Roseateles sp. TaxID=1971397 RepID=UPI00391AA627
MNKYSKHVFAILAAGLGLSSALAKDVCSNDSNNLDKSAGVLCRAPLPGSECLKAGRQFSLGAVVVQGDRFYRCVQARPWALEADLQSVWVELEAGSTAAAVRQGVMEVPASTAVRVPTPGPN